MNISWYRKPLDEDEGGNPRARKLRTTINQVNPVKTIAKNGRIMRRGFNARTRRLVHVRWAPRDNWARIPVFGWVSWPAFRPHSVECIRSLHDEQPS
jgi:hypothetical protein